MSMFGENYNFDSAYENLRDGIIEKGKENIDISIELTCSVLEHALKDAIYEVFEKEKKEKC